MDREQPSAIIAHLRGLLPDVEAARSYARTLATPLDPAVEDYLWTHVGFWGNLDWIEIVAKRPGMYLGGVDAQGLSHTIYQALDGACEEARRTGLDAVVVEVRGDTAFTLASDSRVLPHFFVERRIERGLDCVLGRYDYIVSPPPWSDGSYPPFPVGEHGVGPPSGPERVEAARLDLMFWGLSPACALSSRCEATLWSEAALLHQVFEAGVPRRPTHTTHPAARPSELLETPTGAEIAYDLNPAFFEPGVAFDAAVLARRLDECAALASPTRFTLIDRRSGESRCFHYPGGLAEWLEVQAGDAPRLRDARQGEAREGELWVRVAALWTALPSPARIITFANRVRTQRGTHLDGFLLGVADALRPTRRPRRRVPDPPAGLLAVVAVELPSPVFLNPVKEVLANPEVVEVVRRVSAAALSSGHPPGARAGPPPP